MVSRAHHHAEGGTSRPLGGELCCVIWHQPRPLGWDIRYHQLLGLALGSRMGEGVWGAPQALSALSQASTDLHLEVVEGVLVDVLHLVHQLHGRSRLWL